MDEKTPPLDPTPKEDAKARRKAYMREWYVKNREQSIERAKEWQRKNPERVAATEARRMRSPESIRDRNLRSKYGITILDFEVMAAERGGLCDICKQKPCGVGKRAVLHVDHDHKTGAIRGILCGACNTAIGLLRDDPALLAAAIKYLTPQDRRMVARGT